MNSSAFNRLPNELLKKISNFIPHEYDRNNFLASIRLPDYLDRYESLYHYGDTYVNYDDFKLFHWYIMESSRHFQADSGLCYLRIVKRKLAAFIEYGFGIKSDDLFNCIQKYGADPQEVDWCVKDSESLGRHSHLWNKQGYSRTFVLKCRSTNEIIEFKNFNHEIHTGNDWFFPQLNGSRVGGLTQCPPEIRLELDKYLTKSSKINLALALREFEINYDGRDNGRLYEIRTSLSSTIFTLNPNNLFDVSGNGGCYAGVTKYPLASFINYGPYINSNQLLKCYKRYELMTTPYRFIDHLSNSSVIGHITDVPYYNREIIMKPKNYSAYIPVTSENIRMIQNIEDWILVGPIPILFGSLATYDLEDIVNSQTPVVGYHCPPPEVYISNGKMAPPSTVVINDSNIVITCDGRTSVLRIDDRNLSKIRHEFVASRLMSDTDTKLEVLGITGEESQLTPDFIDIHNKKVCELGTSRAEAIGSLQNEFEGKRLKYDYLLKPLECNTYYIIVGMTTIVSNMLLEQDIVDELCARCRVGVHLEHKIIELIGYNIFTSRSSEDSRIAKAIFSSMLLDSAKSDPDKYPHDKLLDFKTLMNEDDIKHIQPIIKQCLDQSVPKTNGSRANLEKYLSDLNTPDCQVQQKRVTNVPMILCSNKKSDKIEMLTYDSDLPSALKNLWSQANKVDTIRESYEDVITQARSRDNPEIKHTFKKQATFHAKLSTQDEEYLALSGVGAKQFDYLESIKQHQAHSKNSFSPYVATVDIDEFIKSDFTSPGYRRMSAELLTSIIESKTISTANTKQKSLTIWKSLIDTKLISFYDMVTEIFQELSFNYKHWTQSNQFLVKETKSGIKLLIRNTGTHIFVSYAFPIKQSTIIDTGRIGPEIYTSKSHYFTDFCSYNEPTLEHFVKSGPYMTSILIHLMSKFEQEPGEFCPEVMEAFNLISLLFLNNKTDSEELMTSQRYLFMKLFEDATQDPYLFIDRLPEVLRSRLSAYLLNKTIYLMDFYSSNRILKVPEVKSNTINYNYLNLISIVGQRQLTINQKINEFYYGYVVSKERGRGSDRNFKIVKKILQEEYKFRDNVKQVFVDMVDGTKDYCTDPQILKVFVHMFRNVMKDKIGEEYESMIENEFYDKLSFTNFIQLATLKASARDHTELISIPENIDDDRKKLLQALNSRNKDESTKRPKMLEALLKIVNEYKSETQKPLRHMMQLIPWCLAKLEDKGYFDSDIFPKPQHGGDREIHVLEVMARIVQYTVELISRTICKFFSSETITHPETKDKFVLRHYKLTSEAFKASFVISKSADATKWCQRHHVSHFSAMLVGICPKILSPFIIRSLQLWTKKRLSFPLQLVATLLVNQHTFSTNKTFVRFRDEFYKGSGVFSQSMGNKIEITSGMMQGILHYTSSLYHTMIQEVCKLLIVEISRKRYKNSIICSVVQGSDDSGMMLGVEGKISADKVRNMYTLLRFKEEISKYLSVYWNICKSSIGTIDLIEYNSEWHVRHQIIKPTFRWISACMEVSVTERFIDRIRIFNQVLTQCLEGGASTLECAVVQLCQCWLHYLLIGVNSCIISDKFVKMMLEIQDPSLGFFPLDFDISCGMPGVDFQMYCLATRGQYKVPSVTDEFTLQYDYEGDKKFIIPKDLRSVKLKFGKLYLWRSLVDRLGLDSLESAVEAIERDPMVLFGRHTSWDEELPNMILKVFSPGVKESLNNVSSTLRLMAASVYIMTRPCISIYENDTIQKKSLFLALEDKLDKHKGKYNSRKLIEQAFPLHYEYEQLLSSVISLSDSHREFTQEFKRTTKEKIIVFEVVKNESSLIELCKRKWNLGGKISLSSRQFDAKWSEMKLKFPFLNDTLNETKNELRMTTIEVKNFLESIELKSREVVLQDSPVRNGGVISAMTRIYWPKRKLRSYEENDTNDLNDLRAKMFSIMTFWYTDLQTEQKVLSLIKNNKSLRRNFKDVPNKFKKLKIIFDWINHTPKQKIIENLRNLKQGVVGFFSITQGGYGKKRKGPGLWKGQVLGIPCEIHLQDNYVKFITVKYLSDISSLGRMISTLITDFKCEFGKSSYKSNIWLSDQGRIVTKTHYAGNYIPINIDEGLRVDIMKNMEDLPWTVQISNTTIRLCISDNIGTQPYMYTILSESLSQRDWSPDSNFESTIDGLYEWHKSLPMNINELEDEISNIIPDSRSQFLRFYKTLDTHSSQHGWSMRKFKNRLLSILVSPEESNRNKLPIEEEDLFSDSTKQEILDMMALVSGGFNENSFSTVLTNLNETTLENDEIELTSYQLSDDVIDSLGALAIDMEQVYYHPDREEIDDLKWMKMSQSNNFFQNINKLCELQIGERFHYLYKEAKSDESITARGFIGKLLSLCLGRYCLDGVDTNESLVEITSQSSRQVDTILSQEDLDKLDASELESTISQMETMLKTATGLWHTEINKSLDKYRRLLLLKESPTITSDLERYPYGEVMTLIVSYVFDENISKFSHHKVDINTKLTLMRTELIDHLDTLYRDRIISNHDVTLTREYINKKVISPYLIDVITNCYNIYIDFGLFKLTNDLTNISISKAHD